MLLARPRSSISIILDLKVPSLRVRFCCCMKALAFFHLPLSKYSKKMQSIAWSFSSMDLMAESFLSVSMLFISSSTAAANCCPNRVFCLVVFLDAKRI